MAPADPGSDPRGDQRRRYGWVVSQGFGSMRHLAGRLVGSLWPGGPAAAGERWARSWLAAGEAGLWIRLSGPDRRHAVGVAREVGRQLGADGARRPVMAAALLHDVGKLDAGMGTWSRVAATAVAVTLGRERVAAWAVATVGPGRRRAWQARAGRYVTHDRRGAVLLAAAGSDPFTVAWAAEHHLPAARRSVDPAVGGVLEAADGD